MSEIEVNPIIIDFFERAKDAYFLAHRPKDDVYHSFIVSDPYNDFCAVDIDYSLDIYNKMHIAYDAVISLDPTWFKLEEDKRWFRLSAFDEMIKHTNAYNFCKGNFKLFVPFDEEVDEIRLQSTLSKYFEYNQLPKLKLKN